MKKTINIDGVDPILFVGLNDQNIKVLEESYNSKIVVRGSSMNLNGKKEEIIDIELAKLFNRINELGYLVEISKEATSFIADKGFDQKFGARPLNRAIQKLIEDPLAEKIIQKNVNEGDTISIDFDEKNKTIVIKAKKKRKTKKKEEEEDETK